MSSFGKYIAATVLTLTLLCPLAAKDTIDVSVVTTGNLWGTEGFSLNDDEQKDNDSIHFTYDGKTAGGSFRLWTQLDSKVDTGVKYRYGQVWIKPLPTLKLSVGHVGAGLYTERLLWWKVPTASPLEYLDSWKTAPWSSDALINNDNNGIQGEFTGVEGLWVAAAFAPGVGTKTVTDDEINRDKVKYGTAVKYSINGFGSVGAGWRDEGSGPDSPRLARVGFDITAIKDTYAFVTVIGRWDEGAVEEASEFEGFSVDTYAEGKAGPLSLKARVPVTIRRTGDDGDVNYLSYQTRVQIPEIAQSRFSPYLDAAQEGISFDDPKMLPTLSLGTDIGGFAGAEVNVGASVSLHDGEDPTWELPFKVRVSW